MANVRRTLAPWGGSRERPVVPFASSGPSLGQFHAEAPPCSAERLTGYSASTEFRAYPFSGAGRLFPGMFGARWARFLTDMTVGLDAPLGALTTLVPQPICLRQIPAFSCPSDGSYMTERVGMMAHPPLYQSHPAAPSAHHGSLGFEV